jgi:hypothetical protein
MFCAYTLGRVSVTVYMWTILWLSAAFAVTTFATFAAFSSVTTITSSSTVSSAPITTTITAAASTFGVATSRCLLKQDFVGYSCVYYENSSHDSFARMKVIQQV